MNGREKVRKYAVFLKSDKFWNTEFVAVDPPSLPMEYMLPNSRMFYNFSAMKNVHIILFLAYI